MLTEDNKKMMYQSLVTARGYISLGIKILDKLPEDPSGPKVKAELKELIENIGNANKDLRQVFHLIEITYLPLMEYRKDTIFEKVSSFLSNIFRKIQKN
ncbi:MAG: hypothetical protein QY331_10505 [Melioribacteraceae bacterium]|nr:MAG: hypothetical protein QY331_10505 [Melioribacteraceae bacterium]